MKDALGSPAPIHAQSHSFRRWGRASSPQAKMGVAGLAAELERGLECERGRLRFWPVSGKWIIAMCLVGAAPMRKRSYTTQLTFVFLRPALRRPYVPRNSHRTFAHVSLLVSSWISLKCKGYCRIFFVLAQGSSARLAELASWSGVLSVREAA